MKFPGDLDILYLHDTLNLMLRLPPTFIHFPVKFPTRMHADLNSVFMLWLFISPIPFKYTMTRMFLILVEKCLCKLFKVPSKSKYNIGRLDSRSSAELDCCVGARWPHGVAD